MTRHIHWTVLVVFGLLAAWLMPMVTLASPGPGKFAVLISTGRTLADDTWYHSEYWYDLMLTYRMLIENGFAHDHIYVLYGNGTDFASAHADYQNPYPNPISDHACNRANIQNIFNWLATGNAAQGIPALTNQDFLYVWWMGHGDGGADGGATCNTTFEVSTTGESVTDAELATWTNAISYRRRAFVFMTCYSGGAMDNLQNTATVTMPSCTCTQLSSSANYDVVHGEWTYWVDGALRKLLATGPVVNSDADGNNLVSVQETFNWGSGQPMGSTPQLSDVGGIAPCVFIRLEEPGENVEIFSKDHANDDATIPSNYEEWFHGPDLWVRWGQDGGTTHQEPEYGDTNYVYANVHNIGCAPATNVTVDFSWVEPSGWSNPTLWKPIGTAPISSLAVLASTTVNVPWTTVPLPGFYCLHTRLNVAGDLANTDGRAFMDDNKVQINVTVQNAWAGTALGWFFFIENGGEAFVPIDLVFDTLGAPPGTVIRLEWPGPLEFEDVRGAEVFQSEDGWTVLEISAAEREPATVVGVQLDPGARERAVLIVTMPQQTDIGEEATVTFEEQVNGQTVGGVRFVSRGAAPETVMCDVLRQKVSVFYALAELSGMDEAEQVAEISSEIVASGECRDVEPFLSAMAEIAQLEYILGEQLQELSAEYGPRYVTAGEKLLMAVDDQDVVRIVEAQRELFLYASIILTDALTR